MKCSMICGLIMMGFIGGCSDADSNLPMRSATKKEIKHCLNVILSKYSFKDPDSVKIDDDPEYIRDNSQGVYIIQMYINAKNSYGAYTGGKMAICLYNADGSIETLMPD